MNKQDRMTQIIKETVASTNEIVDSTINAKRRNEEILKLKNLLNAEFSKEEIVEFYKQAMFHSVADAIPLVLHAASVAYNTGVKDVSKINDFYVKVSESMEKDGPVSLQESERKTYYIYRNTTHIHQMKGLFMQSVIRAQKGDVKLGFEKEAIENGDNSFLESMKNFVQTIKSKIENAIKIPNNMEVMNKLNERLYSNTINKPEVVVNKTPGLK